MLKLRDIGAKGLIKDVIPHEVPDGYLTEALNVRFSARGILRWPTAKKLYTVAQATRMASCRRGDGSQIFYASPTALFALQNDGTFLDVSSAPYTATDWHEEIYGRTMIFNDSNHAPQVMEDGDLAFSDLSNWPASTFAKVIRVYKSFWVAIGIQEGAVEKDNVVMWSDACYNNGLPPNWDYNDPASFSAQATIAPGDGKLMEGRVLGDSLIIYAENSATAMTFSGNIQFPMQFRELFKRGAMNRDCVGVFDRRHFVVGPERIWVHDGVNISYVAEGKTERAIYADMADRDQVKVVMNPGANEAQIYFRSSAAGSPYVAWVWNWQYGTWSRVELSNIRHIWYGPPQSSQTLWSELQTNGVDWSELSNTLWSDMSGERQTNMLFELNPTAIRQAFYDYDVDAVQPYKVSRIQRVGIDLDAAQEFDSGVVKFIRRVYPIMSGSDGAVVRFRFGGAKSPDGAILWTGWQNYDVQGGVKVDTRVTGRYLAFEMEGPAGSKGGWGLTGFDIDVDAAAGR